MIDIDKLEELATDATPGPWEASAYGSVHPTGRSGSIVTALTKSGMHDGWAQNAPFIAAADPATVLALIVEVRALREDAERWRWIRQGKSVWVKVPVKDKHVEYLIGHKPEPKFPECFDKAVDAARGAK